MGVALEMYDRTVSNGEHLYNSDSLGNLCNCEIPWHLHLNFMAEYKVQFKDNFGHRGELEERNKRVILRLEGHYGGFHH